MAAPCRYDCGALKNPLLLLDGLLDLALASWIKSQTIAENDCRFFLERAFPARRISGDIETPMPFIFSQAVFLGFMSIF